MTVHPAPVAVWCDDRIVVTYPHGRPDRFLISTALFEQMVEQINALNDALDERQLADAKVGAWVREHNTARYTYASVYRQAALAAGGDA